MILFFSATGNSKFVANKIAEYLADKTISLNERIKSENYSLKSFSNPLIIIVPTYAWRIPNIVNEYLLKTPLDKYIKTYFNLLKSSIFNKLKSDILIFYQKNR